MANPKKPPQIEAILRRNKVKLVEFLKNFHNDREGRSKVTVISTAAVKMADHCIVLPRCSFADEQFSVSRHLLRRRAPCFFKCYVLLTSYDLVCFAICRTRNSSSSHRSKGSSRPRRLHCFRI